MEDEKICMEMAYELIENLSYDKIINVRITLGNFLLKLWNKKQGQYNWIKSNKKILEIIYRLKHDKIQDVSNTLIGVSEEEIKKILNYDDYTEILVSKKVNDEFDNKFEDLKVLFGYSPPIFNNKKQNSK